MRNNNLPDFVVSKLLGWSIENDSMLLRLGYSHLSSPRCRRIRHYNTVHQRNDLLTFVRNFDNIRLPPIEIDRAIQRRKNYELNPKAHTYEEE